MSRISKKKKYQTRTGKPVRIICTDAKIRDYPVIALVTNIIEGQEHDCLTLLTEDGKMYKTDEESEIIENESI